DRTALRDLAKVWRPGVPLEDNADYIELNRRLQADLEHAFAETLLHEVPPPRSQTEATSPADILAEADGNPERQTGRTQT
ncbi:hypothetical protein LZ189_13115, partial [Rhodovulum sulfidophilum]|nr:hypothetical protein [Rhodovulum sulfidophilum]